MIAINDDMWYTVEKRKYIILYKNSLHKDIEFEIYDLHLKWVAEWYTAFSMALITPLA